MEFLQLKAPATKKERYSHTGAGAREHPGNPGHGLACLLKEPASGPQEGLLSAPGESQASQQETWA